MITILIYMLLYNQLLYLIFSERRKTIQMNESVIMFLKEDTKRNVYSYAYKSAKGNDILHLEFFNMDDVPSEDVIKSGVLIYNSDNDLVQGDFSDFNTIFKSKENVYELSINEIYEEQKSIVIPEKEYTAEELAELEKNKKIDDINFKIVKLKNQIDTTDYKIIKAYEYSLVGEDTGYDINALHVERENIRKQINDLEDELVSLN